MAMKKIKALDAGLLFKSCDLSQLDFATTDELDDLGEFVGQKRALAATRFGISIEKSGFNIFALGSTGIGKRSIIGALLAREALQKPRALDICYIHNFAEPRYPQPLLLKPGLGKQLARDMQELIDILRTSIPAIFESEAYRIRIKEIQDIERKKRADAFGELEKEASAYDLAIIPTEEGFMLAAMKNNEVLSQEAFKALPEEERVVKENHMREIQESLSKNLELIPAWHKETRDKIKEAAQYFIKIEVGSVLAEAKNKYKNQPAIAAYLNEVEQAIMSNPTEFRKEESSMSLQAHMPTDARFTRYRVNVLVDNSKHSGAPIIYEDNPTLSNIIGRIDHEQQFGALVTDFMLLRAGALHKANGGYLMLDALKLLSQPFAYEALKRALRARQITIENPSQLMGFVGSLSIEPKPVPLDIKVVLLGDRSIYYLLCAYDPEFLELFKVAADFDDDIERNDINILLMAQLLKSLGKKDHLRPLSKKAVGRVIEYSSRLVEDSEKMSTHVRTISDLLREADHWAEEDKALVIDAEHINKTIEQQKFRASRLKEELEESIKRGLLLIDTQNKKVGQINALSYLRLGSFAFGEPVRISARVRVGSGEVIDIDREVRLSGAIHSKGVLILSGYLAGHYAKDKSLSLSASIVFEQSYGMIDGDSASAAEACVLLSAIGDFPIKQSIAITGSMNQHGHVQAIGGVNEKIEGFFDICSMRGLTGDQGVIIPHANITKLMLKNSVVQAAKSGLFHIYAVQTIDEAISILADLPAGTRNKAGNFPKNSVNFLVEAQLAKATKKRRKSR
jgi:lon-related putative ATP-dependent protease